MTETGPATEQTGAVDEVPGTGSFGTPETVPAQVSAPENALAAEAPATPAAEDADGIRLGAMAADVEWALHAEKLARWQQGHLLNDVPVVWLGPAGLDQITGVENARDDLAPVFDPSTAGPAIITTQTCDLGGLPPGSLHPFFQVSPLVRGDRIAGSIRSLARQGRVGYLVPVQSPFSAKPVLNEDGTERRPGPDQEWYADLRVQVPVSKAVLLDRDPIAGFADEGGYLAFAELLAFRWFRPALHGGLSEDLPMLLTKFVKDKGGAKQQCFAKVEQMRVVFLGGDRLRPTRASFYVLTDGLNLDEQEREVWARFQTEAATMLKRHGVMVGPLLHCDVSELSASKYRESVHIYCDQLGPGRFL